MECEFSEYFSGGGVDDGDVEVLDEDQDAGSVVGAADSDVVEASVMAQGDRSGLVDAVGAEVVVGVTAGCWVGFGSAVGSPRTSRHRRLKPDGERSLPTADRQCALSAGVGYGVDIEGLSNA